MTARLKLTEETMRKSPAKSPVKKSASRSPSRTGAGGVKLPAALSVEDVFRACPNNAFRFESTKHIRKSYEIISQDRAVRAIEMGLGIRKPGYNIYVAGVQGTGKTSVIRSFLEKWSGDASTPPDWVYVYDFQQTEQPRAVEMAPGEGRKLRKSMESLIKTLRKEIPTALQSEDYENAVNAYVSGSNERKSKMFGDLERKAKSLDFVIKSTRMGIETIPVVEGRALTEKEYAKLSDPQRESIEDRRSQLEPEVLDFARKVRSIEQETKEYVEKLRSELGLAIVGHHIDPLIETWGSNKELGKWLKSVKEHILENLLEFAEQDEAGHGNQAASSPDDELYPQTEERDRFRRYRVNVFVDNTNTKGAPVIIENNPTYYNLFGKIEKNVEHGMYLTDFTMIKNGAVHRANGGYLVLNAIDIFRTGSIWDTLKRVLKNRLGFIEDMGEQYSLLPTSGLRPEPVPLDLKVILIGNDEIYHLLHDGDEDFKKIFKIKADFDHKMSRSSQNIDAYSSFVATRSQVEGLLPFDRSGVAAIVEHGSRLVEDQRLLSTQFGELKDLTIEADFIAREKKSKVVKREHVKAALDQKYFRVNLYEEHLLEMVRNEDIMLSVDGERIGQVNGLAVYDLGDYSFGKIGRITCTTSVSNDGILNIERASKLSGKIHDKGVYILTGFLNSLLARKHSLGISAAVAFEQSYGMIDGDSATVAELVAILSSMSGIPVRQNCAITGSLNQFGEVQPVGGVNEKVEGFWKTCSLLGKGKHYTVMIPKQNRHNLMLHDDVRAAVAKGTLHVHPIAHINEAFELATGVPLGLINFHAETFAPGSALDIIAKKVETLHDLKHKKHKSEASQNGDSSTEQKKRAPRGARQQIWSPRIS